MKKIVFLFLFFLFPLSVSAKFAVVEIEPQCLLNGETITQTGYNASDTSSWYMPVAYSGECEETPELTDGQKDAIYETFLTYFQKKEIVTPRITRYTDGTQKEYFDMNGEGELFVNKYYFPFLQKKILEERAKETPNYKYISLYRYAADIIGYDYELRRGE